MTETRYATGIARRQEILETALRLLSEKGFRDTSLRAIGRELGIQSGNIVYYFNTREKLLEELILAWDMLGNESHPPGVPFIDGWPERVRRNALVPGLVHLYTAFAAEASSPNHPSHEFFVARYQRVRHDLERNLREGESSGRFRLAVSAERTATILISLSDGLQLQWLVDPTIDMAAELQAAIKRLTT